jgi:hypothetical protein
MESARNVLLIGGAAARRRQGRSLRIWQQKISGMNGPEKLSDLDLAGRSRLGENLGRNAFRYVGG